MARKPQSSEITDWGAYMPVEQATHSTELATQDDPVQMTPQVGRTAITAEGLALLQSMDDARVKESLALAHERQMELARARHQINGPMFSESRLPALPPGSNPRAGMIPAGQLPPGTRRDMRALPPGIGQGALPNARGNQPGAAKPDTDKNGLAGWFNRLSGPRKMTTVLLAGTLAVGAPFGLSRFAQNGESTAAELSKLNQEYPAYDNNNLSCSAAIAKVAFAGGMTVQLKLNLKEPGHTAYFPATAYLGTDLSVAACGVPSKTGTAQPLAEFKKDKYVVNRAALDVTVAPVENAFAIVPTDCKDMNLFKRICINMPKGFMVDGKKATIADKESQKGSNLFVVTTEDGKKYNVSGGEIARVNKLITGPAAKAKPSPEYSQYLTAIATSMKFAAVKALENPETCKPLQDTIDQVIKNAIIARNKSLKHAQPKQATGFDTTTYGSMSADFMSQPINKQILDPASKGHILDVTNFNPTCSASPIEVKETAKL